MAKSIVSFKPRPVISEYQTSEGGLTATDTYKQFGKTPSGALASAIDRAIQGKAYKLMNKAMNLTSGYIGSSANAFGFHNVTGNLFASMGVAMIGGNPKAGHLTVRYSAPINRSNISVTREGLGKNEPYNLEYYADGESVKNVGVYKGETGLGKGKYGVQERQRYVDSLRSVGYGGKDRMYTLYTFIAMPYAKYKNAQYDFFNILRNMTEMGFQAAKEGFR